ncbi:MAG: insulinase family protein [Caldiserica bacterium]|nr:insulinase family protein [Caldisericota bacterium]
MREVYPGCFREEISPHLELVVEPLPHAKSVALGVWLSAGSREDPPGKDGLAHFTEHMVFKGTERHTAAEIARIIDSLGGQINAATSEEYTVYHSTVLAEGLETALGILAELITSPRFAPEEIERERGVALEEIREAEDSPEDVTMRLLEEALWGDAHPLGRPILGRADTVAAISHEDLRGFFETHYRGGHKTVVICGGIEPEVALDLTARLFATDRGGGGAGQRRAPDGTGGLRIEARPIQHIAIGFPTLPAGAPERMALEVLNTVLGGGMSSRLFQRVREERGLAYTITSFVRYYTDAGYLGIYAATEPKRAGEILAIVREELADLAHRGAGDEELVRARRRVRGLFLLGLETPGGRMGRLGWLSALGLPLHSPDQVLRELEAVTGDEVRRLAAEYLAPARASLAMVGPGGTGLERLAEEFVEVSGVA